MGNGVVRGVFVEGTWPNGLEKGSMDLNCVCFSLYGMLCLADM